MFKHLIGDFRGTGSFVIRERAENMQPLRIRGRAEKAIVNDRVNGSQRAVSRTPSIRHFVKSDGVRGRSTGNSLEMEVSNGFDTNWISNER